MNVEELEKNLVLETTCEDCKGTGNLDIGGKLIKCETCEGAGRVMTGTGKKIMEFVWNHIHD